MEAAVIAKNLIKPIDIIGKKMYNNDNRFTILPKTVRIDEPLYRRIA